MRRCYTPILADAPIAGQTGGMAPLPAAARDLENRIRAQIPLARAIDLTITAWDGDTLTTAAPLAPNVNDKGCVFGGSLTSLMTVTGWALVVLALESRGLACDVFVSRSQVGYRAPVWTDFRARAMLDDGADWDRFFASLAARGKARIGVRCDTREAGRDPCCASLTADFVAKKRDPDHAVPSRERSA